MRAFGTSPKKHSSGAHAGHHGHRPGKHTKAKAPGVSPFLSASVPALPRENDPIHDAEYIDRVFQKVPLKKGWEENPKSPLSNFLNQFGASPPVYQHVEVSLHGKRGWRQVWCFCFLTHSINPRRATVRVQLGSEVAISLVQAMRSTKRIPSN
jgi:hypothetical protein